MTGWHNQVLYGIPTSLNYWKNGTQGNAWFAFLSFNFLNWKDSDRYEASSMPIEEQQVYKIGYKNPIKNIALQ